MDEQASGEFSNKLTSLEFQRRCALPAGASDPNGSRFSSAIFFGADG
jgi:hypothetical protein